MNEFEKALKLVNEMFPKRRVTFEVLVSYDRSDGGDLRTFDEYLADIRKVTFGVDHYHPKLTMRSGGVSPNRANFTFEFQVNLDPVPGWGHSPEDWENRIQSILKSGDETTKVYLFPSKIINQ